MRSLTDSELYEVSGGAVGNALATWLINNSGRFPEFESAKAGSLAWRFDNFEDTWDAASRGHADPVAAFDFPRGSAFPFPT